ncbi:MAG: L,D-transpeptidase [Chloroflexota bacterium]
MNQQQRTAVIVLTTLVVITWVGIGALLWRSVSTKSKQTANLVFPTNISVDIARQSIEDTTSLADNIEQPTKQATARVGASPTPSSTQTPTATKTATATRTPKPRPSTTPTKTATALQSAVTNKVIPTPAFNLAELIVMLLTTPTATPTATATPRPVQPLLVDLPTSQEAGRYILVDQDQQQMFIFEDGVQIRTIPVSTGRPVTDAFTPSWEGEVGRYWGGGPFRNSVFFSDYMWYLFPGSTGSILIHSLPYTKEGEQKIYDRPDALGVEPASHGCVRISPEDAEWLKTWNPVDVSIKITRWSGPISPPDLAEANTTLQN